MTRQVDYFLMTCKNTGLTLEEAKIYGFRVLSRLTFQELTDRKSFPKDNVLPSNIIFEDAKELIKDSTKHLTAAKVLAASKHVMFERPDFMALVRETIPSWKGTDEEYKTWLYNHHTWVSRYLAGVGC